MTYDELTVLKDTGKMPRYDIKRHKRSARKSFAWFVIDTATGEDVSGSYVYRTSAANRARIKNMEATA